MAHSITEMQGHITGLITSVVDNLKVYDPDDMIDITAHLAPPFVGLVYLGLAPNGQDNTGRSSKMIFGLYILGTKRNLKSKKGCDTVGDTNAVDEAALTSITQYLQDLREAIGGQQSPSGHKWQLLGESPYNFDDQGIGYLQRWHATVQSI